MPEQSRKSASKINNAPTYTTIWKKIGKIRTCVLIRNSCWYIFTVKRPNNADGSTKKLTRKSNSTANAVMQSGIPVWIKKAFHIKFCNVFGTKNVLGTIYEIENKQSEVRTLPNKKARKCFSFSSN